MSDYNMSLDYHLSQLQQVGADLRAERMLATPAARRSPNRIRVAIGEVLLQIGSTLVAAPARQSIQAR